MKKSINLMLLIMVFIVGISVFESTAYEKSLISSSDVQSLSSQIQSAQVEISGDYLSTSSQITLKWEEVPDADGYRVYMKINGSYTSIKTLSLSNSTTYTIENLNANCEYQFKVKAYYRVNDEVIWAQASDEFTAYTALDNEQITSYSCTQNAIRINWTQNTDAAGYRVYMKINGSYVSIGTVSGSSTLTYRVANLEPSSEYYFKVKAYYRVDGEAVWADASEEFVANTKSDQVVITSSSQTIDAIRINWDKISGADGYRVYMLINGSYTSIKTLSGSETLTYRVSSLSSNTSYSFKVKAYYKVGNTIIWADASEEYSDITDIDSEKITSYSSTEDAIRINWTQNSNAAGYRVYMQINGTYTNIATLSGSSTLTYRVSNLDADTEYSFKVKAYYRVNGEAVWADASEEFSASTQSNQVVITSSSQTDDAVRINWEKVSGCDGYRVYLQINGSYVSIKTLSGSDTLTYRLGSLLANTQYSFKVKAYYKVGNDVLWADASEEYTATTDVAQVKITSDTQTEDAIRINWSTVSGADGYRVYILQNGTYKTLADVGSSTLTYRASGLSAQTTYSFKVKAYRLDNGVYNWGDASTVYKATTDGPTFATFSNVWVTPADEIITPANKTVFLTFDDGPSDRTIEILDILKKYNVKATFFVCAQVPSQQSDEAIAILKRIIAEGHEIGIHSYSHDYSEIYSSVNAFLTDFEKLFNFIYDNTGYKPTVYRFPGGSNTSTNLSIRSAIIYELESRGFVYYDWNSSNQDATGVSYTSAQMASFAISSFKQNGYTIVLMHDFSTKINTPASAELIIKYGLENGYTFDSLTNAIKPIQFV